MFEDFDPPEARTIRHRGFEIASFLIFEKFDPLEATTVCHRGLNNPRPSDLEDLNQRGWLVCRDGPKAGSTRLAWVYKSSAGLQV